MSNRTWDKLNAATIVIEQTLSTGAKKLNLAWRGLSSLPDSITELSHLTELCLTGNQLRQVPDSISRLSSLEYLDLSKNQIERVPDSIGQLRQLRNLDFSSNQLIDIPGSLGSLIELRQLDLSRNFLARLPHSIGQLTRLTELFLSNNPLTELPDSLGELPHLQHLELYYGLLNKLPESIGRLKNLMRLYLLSNRLTEVPESIGNLSFLEQLDLSGNLIRHLPECIGQLTELRFLDLSRNQLKKLPTSIGKLTQLRSLDVSQNELADLPQSLGDLKRLKEFYLTGNPVLAIPTEILDTRSGSLRQSVKPLEILRYYAQIRRGKQPLNEAKLILIGRGGVGKTSIVNRLVHNHFNCNETKTDGIQITEWKVKLNATDDVRLNIWDFGGQEIMHATHQFFLTKRSLYIVVISGREGNEDAEAEYWLKLVEAFGGESPVIVVLNKIGEHPFDLNRRWLQQKYPVIKYFVKTDCRDNVGIHELRAMLECETDRLDHLRDGFPVSWFGIKDQLSGMKSNYLSFEAYRRHCSENGEGDLTAQSALASYLHNLGIVLNYKDDPRLQDTHVLNPHWVTNGIYKILNSERLERQKGEIYLTEVSEILDFNEYPMQMCRFIFDLMKKFDLCFSFPNDEAHYLIPELLDKQEPEEATIFKPEECLNFQYHYPILPEGLLPRFIVRTHVLSEGPTCKRWRTGVILEFEDCRALVKSDPQDKKIFISITGPTLSRRRLLAIIRADFASICNRPAITATSY